MRGPQTSEAQIADAIARLKASKAFKDKEKKLDYWAVVLVGTTKRVPRDFGDNRGCWPVWVGITQNPKAYITDADRRQTLHDHDILELVWTTNYRSAFNLKTALDTLLLGDNEENKIRYSSRDATVDPDTLWPVILGDALANLRAKREVVEVFTEQMRVQRVANEMRRGT